MAQITLYSTSQRKTVRVNAGSGAERRILDAGGFVVDVAGNIPHGRTLQELGLSQQGRQIAPAGTTQSFSSDLEQFLQSNEGAAFRSGIRARERAENPELFEERFREAKENAEAFKSLPGNVGNAPRQNFPIEQLIGEQLEVLRGGLPRTALFQELQQSGQQVREPIQRHLLAGVPPQETTVSPEETLITQATLDDRLEKLAQQIAGSIAASDAANVFPTLSEDERQRFISEATQAAQTEFSPQFEEARELARLQQLSLQERTAQDIAEFGVERQRLAEDVPRQIGGLEGAATLQKGRLGRNLQEAVADTQAALRAQGRTFSGKRGEFEERSARPFREGIEDTERRLRQGISELERGQARTLEDFQRQEQAKIRGLELSLGTERTRGLFPGFSGQVIGGIEGELPIRERQQMRELETGRERTAAELARQRELSELTRNQELRRSLLTPL